MPYFLFGIITTIFLDIIKSFLKFPAVILIIFAFEHKLFDSL